MSMEEGSMEEKGKNPNTEKRTVPNEEGERRSSGRIKEKG